MTGPLFSLELQSDLDLVAARRLARDCAAGLGFDQHDQTRIATAVSEIVRNAVTYGGGGTVDFIVEGDSPPQTLAVRVVDAGPGIPNLEAVLEGPQSENGAGQGIAAARRLVDDIRIDSSAHGTTVYLRKTLHGRSIALPRQLLSRLREELRRQPQPELLAEIGRQNQELLAAVEELERRNEELTRMSSELEETNRGVVALYAELDERAEQLKRAGDTKSRFLSYMSHEFRTPLTSIMALSRLLLNQIDGPLTPEQEKQVTFIRTSADSLLQIVDDLLDLSKVEAGRTEVRASVFQVSALFGTLRGMMKPLQSRETVTLVFEDAASIPPLATDESKVSQILRNFISNALKFTERGEVRVSARLVPDGNTVLFAVSDTGIGIPPEYHEHIFREFTQLDSPLQKAVKGTGLGLPLCRKLAELLGGAVGVESRPGEGSTFWIRIPVVCQSADQAEAPAQAARRVLIVDDDGISRYLIRQSLALPDIQIAEAAGGAEGLGRARREHPRAIFLDLRMPDVDGLSFLEQLRAEPATREIPVIVVTSKTLTAEERAGLEALHISAVLSKEVLTRQDATATMRSVLSLAGVHIEAESAVKASPVIVSKE